MSAKRITVIAVLTAVALTIFIIEAQIPPLAPIPGIKLGLANVVTLFALFTLGKRDAFFILILRVILGSIFAGSVVSCMYSLAGGIVCFILMSVFSLFLKDNMIWCVSIIGAIGHNIGQILAAVIITRTIQVVWYLPILLISATVTGAFTGLMTQQILKYGNGKIKKMLGAIK